MNNRAIVHIDLDAFFVSCERLLDSRLNGLPVLIGGTTDRGVVAASSYEARAYGVHSAMSMKLARQLCPQAIIIKGNTGTYTKYSELVTDIIKDEIPLYEKTSIDEFYLDISGMDKYFGCMKYASELRQRIMRESGLPISFGLSCNKTVSKIATGEAKPNNEMKIETGKEKPFLAPLSVRKIPMVGQKTHQTLFQLGVKTIGIIQEMPVDLMQKALGQNGVKIWNKANGIDNSLVEPHQERKSISTERTFDKDTIDVNRLKTIITAMAENLAFQLRRGKKLSSCVTVKIRYSDFQTKTIQVKIPYTSADHKLIPQCLELFSKLYHRRLLVRLVGIRYSHLVHGNYQIDLFDDNEKLIHLYQTMDDIRERYGDRSIMRVSTMGAKTIGRFNPFDGSPPPLLANRRQ